MKEVHTKIVIDFNFNKNGVDIRSTSNVKDLDVMQKAFITLIYNRIRSVLSDADPNKVNNRCIDLDSDGSKYDRLDKIIDDVYNQGGRVILATPSGARPAWMSEKYPEVLRTNDRREKMLHGGRHNHCFSSPIYREKTQKMNYKL